MPDLVTVGEGLLRLSPPHGDRLETTDQLDFRVAGAESNVAIAAQRLGVDATWLSKLPDSVLGNRVVAQIRRHGVDVRAVRSEDGRQGTYYLEQGGRPRGTNVIYDRADAAVTTATPEELDTGVIDEAALLFTTGITPALSETLEETTSQLLETADRTGFDLNYRKKLWSPEEARETYDGLLPKVDLLFAPARDTRRILDFSGDAETLARDLRSTYDCETVVVTRGDEGALAWTGEELLEQPTFETETTDPIGTGDAFVGGYLSQELTGRSVGDALQYGAATAALKRTITGDLAVVDEHEVQAVLEDDEGGIDR
ncbi:MAG: bifunctional 2-dehydro-3-deoxygluconokinase/2-dehydro-3-deoxygalactonokinase [Halovenus sp.]|uniref:bifunctional 2-dehydro-3-deoxygluconokinase/2-dehydro-3- deoxygalactonokinase n=1 Tax=Halovenus amylolytica TaxID=2500550 RepID=UPI000FE35E8E